MEIKKSARNLIAFRFDSLAGRPGTDYPILSAVPYTNFYCDEQPYPGFFADMETRCQGEAKGFILMSLRQIVYRFFSAFISLSGWHYCGKNCLIALPLPTVIESLLFNFRY